jgi:ABC-type dipeptide/oligopeptide/nickel transport system permease subunit
MTETEIAIAVAIIYAIGVAVGLVICGYKRWDDEGPMAAIFWPLFLPCVIVFHTLSFPFRLGEWLREGRRPRDNRR